MHWTNGWYLRHMDRKGTSGRCRKIRLMHWTNGWYLRHMDRKGTSSRYRKTRLMLWINGWYLRHMGRKGTSGRCRKTRLMLWINGWWLSHMGMKEMFILTLSVIFCALTGVPVHLFLITAWATRVPLIFSWIWQMMRRTNCGWLRCCGYLLFGMHAISLFMFLSFAKGHYFRGICFKRGAIIRCACNAR